eukprot:355685-Chlamydomonas_euryale.AAC.2
MAEFGRLGIAFTAAGASHCSRYRACNHFTESRCDDQLCGRQLSWTAVCVFCNPRLGVLVQGELQAIEQMGVGWNGA